MELFPRDIRLLIYRYVHKHKIGVVHCQLLDKTSPILNFLKHRPNDWLVYGYYLSRHNCPIPRFNGKWRLLPMEMDLGCECGKSFFTEKRIRRLSTPKKVGNKFSLFEVFEVCLGGFALGMLIGTVLLKIYNK